MTNTYSVSAGNVVRDVLRTYLTDPYTYAGGLARSGSTWIFYNEPNLGSKYPIIEISKLDNPSEPIDIGSDYTVHEQLILNIWFYSKNGFKVKISDVEYVNAQLVELYLGKIKETLKAKYTTLDASCAKMYKCVNSSAITYDPDTQLYYGNLVIRVAYFNR
jgi:hypothetical protein